MSSLKGREEAEEKLKNLRIKMKKRRDLDLLTENDDEVMDLNVAQRIDMFSYSRQNSSQDE